MIESVLVANRGEIAVRIAQACHELGIEAVGVYSDTDEGAKHVRQTDRAIHLGESPATDSYLNAEAILNGARDGNVDAIHPGYGFFAENAAFAERVEDEGLVWVGPPSEVMERLGEKTQARREMQAADVPIVPGTTNPVSDPNEVYEFAADHGYPVAIKAAGGGGGRGLVVVDQESEVKGALRSAKHEGEEFFDNSDVYVERFLENPRHIEVQIVADEHGNVRHLGERDCSIQRRQQKLIEETPSPALDAETRADLCEAARSGMNAAGYVNAGTVEFLYEKGEFYFLEVNTRIQVEHTITEVVTGIDLAKTQLRVAAGQELSFAQSDVEPRGSAIEFRINAEDPANDFMPRPGTLERYRPPRGIGVRVDDGVDEGDAISPFYDSMIGKFLVWGADREEAVRRGRRALREADVEGIPTTIPFHLAVLDDETFLDGAHTTKFVDEVFEFPVDAPDEGTTDESA